MKIFNNEIDSRAVKKAEKSQRKYIKQYGDDRNNVYHLKAQPNKTIGDDWGVLNLEKGETEMEPFGDNSVIVGNIRMGFGHYRISMAVASAAKAMGYTPYWLDLNAFPDTTMTKIIAKKNDLYSLGSRLSQKSTIFNKLVWDPMNSEGFRKLAYNASDEITSTLMTRVFKEIPTGTPFVATHAWAAQAAVHAGMTRVVNAIPDNWPMALHLAEGSIHTVQTPSAYMGYKALRGMDKKSVLSPMTEGSLVYTGHYIDHELVAAIEADTEARLKRLKGKEPLRFMISVGGAGAQKDIFIDVIKTLLPYVKAEKAALFINVGDHRGIYEELCRDVPELNGYETYFDDFGRTRGFVNSALSGAVTGIHSFYHGDIFEAVYSTNLLMRCCDVLITKPSELAYYPVPKLMIKRVGGHEAWGAICAAEVGDGTYEIGKIREISGMIELMLNDSEPLVFMNGRILEAKKAGIYDGAYKVIELATGRKYNG